MCDRWPAAPGQHRTYCHNGHHASCGPGPGRYLGTLRWPEVARGPRRLLVVPVGSLEQHGPHLPMDTDTRIAVAVASRACDGRDGVGLAPAVAIGASGEHAGFPGTLSIGTEALRLLLVELGRHASLHWPAMLLVNGHGGNAEAITAAARALRAEGRACHAWHAGLPGSRLADPHAGRFETSVLLALAPELVRLEKAAPGRHPAAARDHAGTADARRPRGQPQRRPRRPGRRVRRRGRGTPSPADDQPRRSSWTRSFPASHGLMLGWRAGEQAGKAQGHCRLPGAPTGSPEYSLMASRLSPAG